MICSILVVVLAGALPISGSNSVRDTQASVAVDPQQIRSPHFFKHFDDHSPRDVIKNLDDAYAFANACIAPDIAAAVPMPGEALLLAKAQPDECYYGIGNPNNIFPFDFESGDCPDLDPHNPPIAKINEGYPWGMAEDADTGYIYWGTGSNVQCLVPGGLVGIPGGALPSIETFSYVCEFSESQAPTPAPNLVIPGGLGDYRAPRFYYIDPRQPGSQVDITPDDPNVERCVGGRSAGAHKDVVFIAGPAVPYLIIDPQNPDNVQQEPNGIYMFAFHGPTGAYLGSQFFPQYTNIRQWLVTGNVLYTTVQAGDGTGRVLRWNGNVHNPFDFIEVGNLRSEGAFLAEFRNCIFVTTWPRIDLQNIQNVQVAALYRGPVLPEGGYTAANFDDWEIVWDANEYERDPVIASSYAGGALAKTNNALIFGTMHVPLSGLLANIVARGVREEPVKFAIDVLATHRAFSVFRYEPNQPQEDDVTVLYGYYKMPTWDDENERWVLRRNGMNPPELGLPAFGNFFGAYYWSSTEYKRDVVSGTFDWGYLLAEFLLVPILDILEEEGIDVDLQGLFDVLPRSPGADVVRFENAYQRVEFISKSGLLNFTNYGVRTLLKSRSHPGLVFGMANPMNLLSDPDDNLPEGGWELIHYTD